MTSHALWPTVLRRTTTSLHTQLDSLAVLAVFKHEHVTRDQYQNALRCMYRPHAYLENRIQQAQQQGLLPYSYQPRQHKLRDDLYTLGGDVPSIPTSDSPVTTAETWGYLYLLEGSKQGSRFIQKRLAQQAITLPSRFMGHVSDTQSGMQSFWRDLEAFDAEPSDTHAVVIAAQRAFQFYIDAVRYEHLNPDLLHQS